MRILITGAGGGVGQALSAALAAQQTVLACDHARLDITDPQAVREAVRAFRPDAIVNPAAITNVDRCEENPEEAQRVNALAPGFLAEAAEAVGACFVQLSTDYVFDGAKGAPYVETDPPCPMTVYGQAKRAGEVAALAACSRTYIARTAWVMNPARPGFLAAMVAAARQGQARVARQISSPTGLADLVQAVTLLITARPAFGVYHCVNSGQCSRQEMAAEVFRLCGVAGAIDEVPLSVFSATPRPTFSALAAPAWFAAGLPPFRPWQAALAEVLRGMAGEAA